MKWGLSALYLHENNEIFPDAINLAALQTGLALEIIEKDYYVTMILNLLSEQFDHAVFKGGTSLQKCYRIISRFSEDIDITIDTALSQGQKKLLKNGIVNIAEKLGLKVLNLDEIRSRRNYNRYVLSYKSSLEQIEYVAEPAVLLETSFTELSFPTLTMPVHSYLGDLFYRESPELLDEYELYPFSMKVQCIDRTLIDKVFALCDYMLTGNTDRHSRHIYDIYKLLPLVKLDDNLRSLIKEVRKVRAKNSICPSALDGIDVNTLLKRIVDEDIYKSDYNLITTLLLGEKVSYQEALTAIKVIKNSEIFC